MWTFAARALTRLASAVGLLALVAGIPVGQLRYIGWPLPDRMPTGDELQTALTSRDWMTDATLVDGLAALLWLLWALFVVSVMVELVASIRGVPPPDTGCWPPPRASPPPWSPGSPPPSSRPPPPPRR